ncbi:CLUMA_CG021022, isoform A [Clunio marinus]|uniref:CLUMA_CG021022, isoform A n=1 Tax=Clunio marinus TaxID=568069 RepID=A0A1J1J6I3_9DIPT|nr:CLUMA_CG021022, isoform A [Clunio marinus]
MAQEARDSGISVDNDNESQSSITSSFRDYQISYVQRLRKRFEILAKEQEKEFHSECNWWLEEEDLNENIEKEASKDDTKTHDNFSHSSSLENVSYQYSNQSLIIRQASSESSSSKDKTILKVTPATPIKSPTSPEKHLILNYPGYEEINDSNNIDKVEEEDDNNQSDFYISNQSDIMKSALDDGDFVRMTKTLSVSRPDSLISQTSNTSQSKLFNIVRELLENEENYCRSLRNGVSNYLGAFNKKDIPRTLRGQKLRIFANIKSIYEFHEYEFLPRLTQCGEDPEQIAEVFTSFITKGFFYGYIIYAINRKRSELLCNYHVDFWKQIQNECGDRLGINSFLLQPIQRLPRYQLLLNEIIKDLMKDLENTKQAVAACCVAEKNVQRLLDTVNESMSINDIRNCYEIDVFCQGKFIKLNEFDIYDWEVRRRFRGKVFLFERCVVYTEALAREYMEYRGHIEINKLGIIYKEGKSKFKLFTKKRGQKEVEFRSHISVAAEWANIITSMLMTFVKEERIRNVRKLSMNRVHQYIPDSNRSSVISTKSDMSNFSIGTYRSSSGYASHDRDSLESKKSSWYI